MHQAAKDMAQPKLLPCVQEERTASMEEAARLRGTLSAMDAQLTAAQAAAKASEAARLRSSAEASSLQAELHQVPTPMQICHL